MKALFINNVTSLIRGLVILTQTVANISLASQLPGSVSERQKMKTINIGIVGPKKQLDPVQGYNLFDFLVIQCIYQTIVRINADGNITADLAEKWDISKDGKTYTFHINPNSKFSDGAPVTAKDVGVSLSRHLWPDSKSIIKSYLADLISNTGSIQMNEIASAIKVVSPLVFEIKLKNPYPPFLHILSMPGFSITSASEKLRAANIGSGHLKAHFDNDLNNWILKPNPYYVGTKVNTGEIRISSLKDANEAFQSLRERKTDVVLGLMSETGPGLNSQLPKDYLVYSTNSLSFAHLVFNMKRPEFKDQKLRETLGSYLNGLAKTVSIPSSNFHHQKTFIPKGVLPLSYFERSFENSTVEELSSVIKKHLNKRPYKIIISKGRLPEDFINKLRTISSNISSSFIVEELSVGDYRKRRDSGDYDLAYLGYIGNFADSDGFLDCIRENNFPGISVDSSELFQSINNFRFNPSATERLANYVKALRTFENKWTVIPLYQTNIPILHHKDIAIPDTHYRYESELWSFLWKTE